MREIVCAPGNGGTAGEKKCRNVDIAAINIPALVALAKQERFSLTVVGPEVPLVDGIVDQFQGMGLRIFGPNASAARLEGSKIFGKEMMDEFGIPTASWQWFDNERDAHLWLDKQDNDKPWVVKADGLCGGKGALVCNGDKPKHQTHNAISEMSSFGEAGKRFIIEECLKGVEASFFLLVGKKGQMIPLATAQDYKRARDGDQGPNTGGMGAYSPASHLTKTMISEIIAKLRPLVLEVGFTGLLYVGLMLTEDGWKVLEFNVRFGDPETQVILPRLESDLAEILYILASGQTYPHRLKCSEQACVTIVMTAGGYPGGYQKGNDIIGLDLVKPLEPTGVKVFHAGTKLDHGFIVTDGGRVLNVTALGETIANARDCAYEVITWIRWDVETHRTDIAEGV